MLKLKEIRKDKKISQKQLSEAIGYSQSVICDWENGKSEPTATPLIKLADYFDVTIDYLLGREDEPNIKYYKGNITNNNNNITIINRR